MANILQYLYNYALLNLLIFAIFSLPFYKLVVPTVDTIRYTYLTQSLIEHFCPVLLVGPVGTGKTSVAEGVISKLDPKYYSVLVVNMSAQVSIGIASQLVLISG